MTTKSVNELLGNPLENSSTSPPLNTTDKNTVLTPVEIRTIVREELVHIFGALRTRSVGKSGRRGGISTVKKSISIPKSIWYEFEQVCGKYGVISNHVTAALELYINVHKQIGKK